MYIKALEQEVLRLKELYVQSTRERDVIAEENRQLKALLATHGISYDFANSPIQFKQELQTQPSSSGSISGSYGPASDSTSLSSPPPTTMQYMQHDKSASPQSQHTLAQHRMAQLPSTKMDYDQVGIDFVLTCDSPGTSSRALSYPSPPSQP